MSDFIRLDTGKFKTHASVPYLLVKVAFGACNHDLNLRPATLLNVIELWEIFKQSPSTDNILKLIHLYALYIDSIDKEKVQSFTNSTPKDKYYSEEEIFAIIYENHTVVTQKGAEKYPTGNWLKMQPSEVVRCIEPCERHMIYYPLVKGEIVDSENGLPHYMSTIWNLVAIYRVMLIDEEVCRKAILGEV